MFELHPQVIICRRLQEHDIELDVMDEGRGRTQMLVDLVAGECAACLLKCLDGGVDLLADDLFPDAIHIPSRTCRSIMRGGD